MKICFGDFWIASTYNIFGTRNIGRQFFSCGRDELILLNFPEIFGLNFGGNKYLHKFLLLQCWNFYLRYNFLMMIDYSASNLEKVAAHKLETKQMEDLELSKNLLDISDEKLNRISRSNSFSIIHKSGILFASHSATMILIWILCLRMQQLFESKNHFIKNPYTLPAFVWTEIMPWSNQVICFVAYLKSGCEMR